METARDVSAGFIAGIAVAVLLGGGAVAASFLPPGSVDTAQIRDQAVTNSRIANDAVGTKKIREGAVTTKEIKDGTIRPIDFSWTTWSAIADVPGRQGAPGSPGAPGATGAVGATGTCVAQTILNGSGAPKTSTGQDGDFYIDTQADIIYGPTNGGTWPTPGTSLVGPTGATGPTGAQGDPGATGAAGPQGDPGATGATGATGPKGDAGTSLLNGCVPPEASTGNDGDFYIDTAASVIYGPKASGAWPSPGTSLVGPTGATGPAGPAGGTFAPEYGQWSSTQTQGGAAFAGGAIIPLTHNVQDITPSAGISVDANGWNWRFTSPGTWAGGFSAQIRKTGNGTAAVAIWWQNAAPSSGCDEDTDFSSTPNSATRARLSGAGEQTVMTVVFVFPVPAGGMCGRLVANAEGSGTEPEEMEILYEPAAGNRPGAPSIISNVWRVG